MTPLMASILFHLTPMEGSTSAVTDDHSPRKHHVPEGKGHMITVQPLRRSEMQVGSLPHLTGAQHRADILAQAVVCPGSGNWRSTLSFSFLPNSVLTARGACR